jgi:hypothetical protein
MMIVNDDPRVISKLEASLTDEARVIIYNRHMFIVQATDRRFVSISFRGLGQIFILSFFLFKNFLFQAVSVFPSKFVLNLTSVHASSIS